MNDDESQMQAREVDSPAFAQASTTQDPVKDKIKHVSDSSAYKMLDQLTKEKKVKPIPFPAPRGGVEPVLTLAQVLDDNGKAVKEIESHGRIVFHSTGDVGATQGPKSEETVVDKLISDFSDASVDQPRFALLLGDIVYSFGEAQYYYDQFYEPFRDYPAPILAVPGNHDGMPNPLGDAETLAAYLDNFCAESFHVTADAGGLDRTAQIQPGVFYTFEAPFVRIITLYSNALEDPGVIASGEIGDSQIQFLDAALARIKHEKFAGAVILATHHPSYSTTKSHGWSVEMTQQIDKVCEAHGVWPHAFLAGHAHNYQRFTRTLGKEKFQIPYIVCGNGGHGIQKLSRGEALRVPVLVQPVPGTGHKDHGTDTVSLDNYDDQDYGYLRVIANGTQLRIEYHPASDGGAAKTPDDHVTVDLKHHTLTQYEVPAPGE